MDEKTLLDVAKEALRRGDFKSGNLAAFVSIAESLERSAETQNDIKKSLALLATLTAQSMGYSVE